MGVMQLYGGGRILCGVRVLCKGVVCGVKEHVRVVFISLGTSQPQTFTFSGFANVYPLGMLLGGQPVRQRTHLCPSTTL